MVRRLRNPRAAALNSQHRTARRIDIAYRSVAVGPKGNGSFQHVNRFPKPSFKIDRIKQPINRNVTVTPIKTFLKLRQRRCLRN